MELSPETIMLAVYAISITMVILGVAIGFSRLHQKLNNILLLLTKADKHNDNQICNTQNNGQDIFPASRQVTEPDKTPQNNPNKDDCDNKDSRIAGHGSIV